MKRGAEKKGYKERREKDKERKGKRAIEEIEKEREKRVIGQIYNMN